MSWPAFEPAIHGSNYVLVEMKKPRFREATGGSTNQGASTHREKRLDQLLYAGQSPGSPSPQITRHLDCQARKAQKNPASARRAKTGSCKSCLCLSKCQPNISALTIMYTITLGTSHQAMLILDFGFFGSGWYGFGRLPNASLAAGAVKTRS
jgi:hypothetical protein